MKNLARKLIFFPVEVRILHLGINTSAFLILQLLRIFCDAHNIDRCLWKIETFFKLFRTWYSILSGPFYSVYTRWVIDLVTDYSHHARRCSFESHTHLPSVANVLICQIITDNKACISVKYPTWFGLFHFITNIVNRGECYMTGCIPCNAAFYSAKITFFFFLLFWWANECQTWGDGHMMCYDIVA